jgi:hypothetical protein
VGWCRNPGRLDPRLRDASLKIADRELAQANCSRSAGTLAPCEPIGSGAARALEHSAQLLRAARSNGAIFLALPANGPGRNSINDEASLLRVMCQSSQATSCRGSMAAQAEFRTNGGTWKRVGGLLLIVAGVLGMLLLLGFIALRLLGAAIFSLLYLLVAPAAVLAPALGEAGRRVFRGWATQLLGAVLAKLVFAFLLGIVLAVLSILAALEALGWWTQWLLMSAFWWGAYGRRHQVLNIAGGALSGGESSTRPRWAARRAVAVLRPPRRLAGAVRAAGSRLANPGRDPERLASFARAGRQHARTGMNEQARRSLQGEEPAAGEGLALLGQMREQLSAKRGQLSRIERARAEALASERARRAAELGHRAGRVKEEIEAMQDRLTRARSTIDGPTDREAIERRGRFLDLQARLPGGAHSGTGTSERRDYAGLAGLAGYAREEYERLDPRRRREARIQVDRELALRREMYPAAKAIADDAEARADRHAAPKAHEAFDRALERRMRDGGRGMPASRSTAPLQEWARVGRGRARITPPRESSVMQDAREVAERRKRQLGRDRS